MTSLDNASGSLSLLAETCAYCIFRPTHCFPFFKPSSTPSRRPLRSMRSPRRRLLSPPRLLLLRPHPPPRILSVLAPNRLPDQRYIVSLTVTLSASAGSYDVSGDVRSRLILHPSRRYLSFQSLPTYSRPPPLPPLPPQTPPMGGHHTSQGSMSPLGGPPAPQLPLGGASGSPVARPPWPPGAAPGAGFGYQSPPPPPLPPTSPTGSVTSQNQQPPYSGHRIPYPGQQPPPRMPSTDPPSGPGWATPSPPLPGWQGHHQQRESIGGGGPPPPQIPGTLHAFSQQQQPYRPPPPPLTAQLQQPFPSSFLSTGPPPPSVQALPPPIPTPSTRPPVASTPSVPIPDLLSAASPPPSPSAEKSALPSAGPPPPPPPNPELLLLHSHLHSHLSAARDATLNSLQTRRHRLSQIRADLASAEPAIEDEKARLGAVRDVCLGVGDRMRGSVKELEARVAMLEQRGEISVDEVVCSTTIVYNQCASRPSLLFPFGLNRTTDAGPLLSQAHRSRRRGCRPLGRALPAFPRASRRPD